MVLMRIVANEKNITLTCAVQEKIEIFVDESMFKTVLRNLISNAIKYSNNNGQITIFAEKDNANVTITVSDNGVGIDKEDISKLFEFTSEFTTKGTAGESGTGFGLTLCKEFVEKHGGKIWVESVVGKGSDFKFSIPVNKNPKGKRFI
jgi:signal transduction histidine kinase